MARQPAIPPQQKPRVDQVAIRRMADAVEDALFLEFLAQNRQHSAFD